MNLLHAIEIRKSVRAYTQTPVEKEKTEAIIRAGSLAPVFGQFHITVIENPGLLQEIGQVTLEMMKNSGDEFLEKRAASKGYNPLYGAPVMILLSAPGGNDSKGFNMANISCAAENMIIQASDLGLGTCFVMGPTIAFSDPSLTKKIELPQGYIPLAGVLIGYPAESLTENKRKLTKNITYIR
ncbi:MAG TPA: nitroreductase family protein [Candidatus Blautia faecipullorum]|nr:nitroreductase family protein [Candidatus Blautia faecipullorum]